jgi:hypothetical protein
MVELPFQIVREVWSSYELEDGTVLRSRTILTKVLGPRLLPEKGAQVPLKFAFSQINVVTSPPDIKGTPNPMPKPIPELQGLPTEDVDFKEPREAWNLYRITGLHEPVGLKTKVVVTAALKVAGEFDQEGNPMFIINSTTLVVPAKPKELQSP